MWFAVGCAVFLIPETESDNPADLVEFAKILASMTVTDIQLERAALDLDIATIILGSRTAKYDYKAYTTNLNGIYWGLGLVDKAVKKLTADVWVLTKDANKQDIPKKDYDNVSDDLDDVAKALSEFDSYFEALFTGDAQKTEGWVTVEKLTRAVYVVSRDIDKLTDAVNALKKASYPVFQFFFCATISLSNICGGLNHTANALNHLASEIERKAKELNDPKVTPQAKDLANALNHLACDLRELCIAVSKNCPTPRLPALP